MNVRIEGNRKKPTKQWPKNLYYECEFIAEHYMNTLVKFWNFSHRISRLRAIDCSNCDCVSRHDDCSRGWDFISGIWPFSNFFLNMGRERRWPRWIKKGVAYRYQATVMLALCSKTYYCRDDEGHDKLSSKGPQKNSNSDLWDLSPCLDHRALERRHVLQLQGWAWSVPVHLPAGADCPDLRVP